MYLVASVRPSVRQSALSRLNHFSVPVSQRFLQKDLGVWVGQKSLSERIVEFKKPVHFQNVLFMKTNTSVVLQMK